MSSEQSLNSRQFVLAIEVLNDKSRRQLISQFTVDIHPLNLGSWQKFQAKNSFSQELNIEYKLSCAQHFGGSRCERPICPFACQNGGRCHVTNGMPVCKCDPLFGAGELCEIRVVRACGNKCLNGGSCLGGGECLCAPGYAGARCQSRRLPSQCGQVTCYNGGTCMIDNRNEYTCLCHAAFSGKYCGTRIMVAMVDVTPVVIPVATTMIVPDVARSKVVAKGLVSRGYSVQEIILIIVLGVGMPVFAIMCAVIICRLSRGGECKGVENGDMGVEKCGKEVGEPVVSVSERQVNVNVFNEGEEREKEVSVRTISSEINAKGFDLRENSVYAVFNCADVVATEVSLKNASRSARLGVCAERQGYVSEYGVLASMV